jgi:hypothetical protein
MSAEAAVSEERSRAYGMLRQYFAWSDALMRLYSSEFGAACARAGVTRPLKGDPVTANRQADYDFTLDELIRQSALMTHWYAALWVVCEGWMSLRILEPAITDTIQSRTGEKLRRFRHAVCHFQRSRENPRFTDFIEDGVLLETAIDLHSRLLAFFDKNPFLVGTMVGPKPTRRAGTGSGFTHEMVELLYDQAQSIDGDVLRREELIGIGDRIATILAREDDAT